MDMFMTDTARLADVVLLAASGFERQEIYDFHSVLFGIPYLMLRKNIRTRGYLWKDELADI